MSNIAALFDLDGTLSRGGVWNGFFKYYRMRKKKRTWILTFWATHLPLWLLTKCKLYSGEKCRLKWTKDMSGIFKRASKEEALNVFRWVADNYILRSLRSDVVEIMNWHKQNEHIVVIVSATYSEVLEIVGESLGVPNVIGTRLEVIDGEYTGNIVEPLCFGENKAILFKEFIKQNGLKIDFPSSFAYADSIFDVPLLELAGNPVTVYPDKDLRLLSGNKGWRILSDLTQIDS